MTKPRGMIATLRDALKPGEPLKALTVLTPDKDPFRVDSERKAKAGYWLAARLAEVDAIRYRPQYHVRGFHYAVLGATMPNGEQYVSTYECWNWLQNDAVKAARWLKLIPGDRFKDSRNDWPVYLEYAGPINPRPAVDLGLDLFGAEDMHPRIGLAGFTPAQPFHIVLAAEKEAASEILIPLAEEYGTDYTQATGEISDRFVWTMADRAVKGGRPLIVLNFSDADPAGWQMPISIARELQACRAVDFPDLSFKVVRVALTPAQAVGLPETPIKENEKRSGRWFEATGRMQTELDAMVIREPDAFERVARDAIESWFDVTLAGRVAAAQQPWEAAAQAAADAVLDADPELPELRQAAADAIDAVRDRIDADLAEVEFPQVPAVPEPVPLAGTDPAAVLCASDDDFRTQCLKLIASKAYRDAT